MKKPWYKDLKIWSAIGAILIVYGLIFGLAIKESKVSDNEVEIQETIVTSTSNTSKVTTSSKPIFTTANEFTITTSSKPTTTTSNKPTTTTSNKPVVTTSNKPITTAPTISSTQNQNKEYVYITPSGKKWHKSPSCGGKNSYSISFDRIGNRTPCAKCAK